MRGLGRVAPPDWRHVERHALTAAPTLPHSVALGVNWYEAFYTPSFHAGRWWIGRQRRWGRLAGGHCIAAQPVDQPDLEVWWDFYDQGEEGACVGFGLSRVQSLSNRETYHARWLYDEARKLWSPEDGSEGTSVRAGCEVLRTLGHRLVHTGFPDGVGCPVDPPSLDHGIRRYEWATDVGVIVDTLADRGDAGLMRELDAIPLLNSWGRSYPEVTWLPLDVLDRLLGEDGEAAVITDA